MPASWSRRRTARRSAPASGQCVSMHGVDWTGSSACPPPIASHGLSNMLLIASVTDAQSPSRPCATLCLREPPGGCRIAHINSCSAPANQCACKTCSPLSPSHHLPHPQSWLPRHAPHGGLHAAPGAGKHKHRIPTHTYIHATVFTFSTPGAGARRQCGDYYAHCHLHPGLWAGEGVCVWRVWGVRRVCRGGVTEE